MFKNKVALVTGGAKGIGKATTDRFLEEGAAVVIIDWDYETCDKVTKEMEEKKLPFIAVKGDVREPADCEKAVNTAVSKFGGLDICYCNAGVFEPGTVETQTEEEWDYQIDVLMKGTFLTCKYAVPAIAMRGGGSIILSGSNCAHIGCAGRFAYTAAKAAMPILAKQLSNDYFHSKKIRTNCISPGYVLTSMTENIWRKQTKAAPDAKIPPEQAEQWQKPVDIANVILFLASEAARDVTGVTVPISRTAILRVATPNRMGL